MSSSTTVTKLSQKEQLKKLSDFLNNQNNGISPADRKFLNSIFKAVENSPQRESILSSLSNLLDQNRDGKITKKEFEAVKTTFEDLLYSSSLISNEDMMVELSKQLIEKCRVVTTNLTKEDIKNIEIPQEETTRRRKSPQEINLKTASLDTINNIMAIAIAKLDKALTTKDNKTIYTAFWELDNLYTEAIQNPEFIMQAKINLLNQHAIKQSDNIVKGVTVALITMILTLPAISFMPTNGASFITIINSVPQYVLPGFLTGLIGTSGAEYIATIIRRGPVRNLNKRAKSTDLSEHIDIEELFKEFTPDLLKKENQALLNEKLNKYIVLKSKFPVFKWIEKNRKKSILKKQAKMIMKINKDFNEDSMTKIVNKLYPKIVKSNKKIKKEKIKRFQNSNTYLKLLSKLFENSKLDEDVIQQIITRIEKENENLNIENTTPIKNENINFFETKNKKNPHKTSRKSNNNNQELVKELTKVEKVKRVAKKVTDVVVFPIKVSLDACKALINTSKTRTKDAKLELEKSLQSILKQLEKSKTLYDEEVYKKRQYIIEIKSKIILSDEEIKLLKEKIYNHIISKNKGEFKIAQDNFILIVNDKKEVKKAQVKKKKTTTESGSKQKSKPQQ